MAAGVDMQVYSYDQLGLTNREIRLLKFRTHTFPDGSNSSLSFELQHVSLKEYTIANGATLGVNQQSEYEIGSLVRSRRAPEPFYALSYVWGDGLATEVIQINGSNARISKSLLEALNAIK
jgi:hypothetical protein